MTVYVISLQRAKERRALITKRLRDLNIEFEFIDAVDGRNLKPGELEKYYDRQRCLDLIAREMKPGEIGCALSHRMAYRKIIDSGESGGVILEDDILIADTAFQVLNKIYEVSPLDSVVLLGSGGRELVCSVWNTIDGGDGYRARKAKSDPWTAWGYYIGRIAAANLLSLGNRVYTVADHWAHFKQYVKVYVLSPSLIEYDISLGSDIESIDPRGDISNHEKASQFVIVRKMVRFLRSLKRLFWSITP